MNITENCVKPLKFPKGKTSMNFPRSALKFPQHTKNYMPFETTLKKEKQKMPFL